MSLLEVFLQSAAGKWLGRRFSHREVFGLSLTMGIFCIALLLWLLGGIVQDVIASDPLVRVDLEILHFFHSHDNPYLLAAAVALEDILSPVALLPAAALAGGAMLLVNRKGEGSSARFCGVVLLATTLGTCLLWVLLGFLFHRSPPPDSLRLASRVGYGEFPSVHAMTMFALGIAGCYLLYLRTSKYQEGLWHARVWLGTLVATTAMVLVGGVESIYTGAQYPSDVLAGWASGGAGAFIVLTASELFRRLRASGEPLPEASVQYAKFSVVGISNALVDLGTINVLLLLFPTRSAATLVLYNLVALTLANINSYLWNTLWTFRDRSRRNVRQLGMFALQAVISIGVGNVVLYLVAHWLASYSALPSLAVGDLSKLASMFVGSTTSFLLLRSFVFRPAERHG